jgi:hypothetical protein
MGTASAFDGLLARASRSNPPTSSSLVDEKRVDSLLLSTAARDSDARQIAAKD